MVESNISWIESPPENYNVLKNADGDAYFVHKLATLTSFTQIGKCTYIHGKSRFTGDESIVIGSFCSIANDVRIQVADEHDYKHVSTFPFATVVGMRRLDYNEKCGKGVTIGNDVWIGEGVRILSGANIGNGAVVGAGSVVRGILEPYGIYAGNPLSLRRMRCDEVAAKKLSEIKWWDWDLQKIQNNGDFFSLSLAAISEMTMDDIQNIIK